MYGQSHFRRRWQPRVFALWACVVLAAAALSACGGARVQPDDPDEEIGTIIEQGPSLPTDPEVVVEETQPAPAMEQPPVVPAAPAKHCVILGPGLALGMAHVGVLQALQEAGQAVDCLAGVEMGAVVAALYADKANTNHVKWQLFKLKKDIYLERSLLSLVFRKISGSKAHQLFKEWFGERTLGQLKLPLAIVVEDAGGTLRTLPSDTRIADALSASVALPGIFEGWTLEGTGQLVSPLRQSVFSLDAAQSLGATLTVVDVLAGPRDETPENKLEQNLQALFLATEKIGALQLQDEAQVRRISLNLRQFAPWDLQRQEELFSAGLEGARAAILQENAP